MPELTGHGRFAAAFQNRHVIDLNGTEICVIGYYDLISDKEANARPKDLIDIEQLKANRSE